MTRAVSWTYLAVVYHHYEPEKNLLVVNAGNIAKDWDWCVSHNTVGANWKTLPTVLAHSWLSRARKGVRSFAAPDPVRPVFHSLTIRL